MTDGAATPGLATPRSPQDEATRAQTAAARPDRSVWVSANAGSGKTRVLTNRVARLLLAGADPARILCLTYTKAAAAEMQNRLFKTLGGWTMADDAALARHLTGLLAEDEPDPDAAARAEARRLFARALETPGGLRIQTIHAFCESLLRRFPLEAGVSPHFQVLDEATAAALAQEAIDAAAAQALSADPALAPVFEAEPDDALAAAFATLLARLKETGFDDLMAAARAKRRSYARAAPGDDGTAALAAALGVPPTTRTDTLLSAWFARTDESDLAALADSFGRSDKKGNQTVAAAFRAAAAAHTAAACFQHLRKAALKADGAAKTHNFPTKDLVANNPGIEPRLRRLQQALETLAADLNTAERLEASDALARVNAAALAGYAARKALIAGLDYDDLIDRAVGLLTRSEARDWVRYKLDGGVEHILVDEAQDTSPAQWAAVEALAEEFFAGEGVERADPRDGSRPAAPRTLFAVGDEKQSIYSFQGAAPELLSAKGRDFAERARAAGAAFERRGMATSFRSCPVILAFVDRVFEPPAARAGLVFGVETGEAADIVRHEAFRVGAPGRVDLWPLAAPRDEAPPPEWDAPVDAPPPDDPEARLASLVSDEIAGWIGTELLPARGRAIRAGDVLVLVRKRGALSEGIIKGLKTRGVAVAGADRLSLTAELAVRDLLALARFCLAPDDDLTVATLLRSPFCDVDEEGLFDLAHRRPGRRRLFYELQERRGERQEYAAAYALLSDMLRRADFERPFELLSHALGPLEGRRRLAARLGSEALDPIDELMAETLRFERGASPTLEAFVARMSETQSDVKRETEHGRDEVRVMTAHGAKGLEAPVVVLPDTCGTPEGGGGGRPLLLDSATPGAPPIWAGAKVGDPEPVAALRTAASAREAEEHRRLLYVALTRAEDRLLICGATRRKQPPPQSWYALCAAAAAEGADGAQEWAEIGTATAPPSPVEGPSGVPLAGWRLTGAENPAPPPPEAPPAASGSDPTPTWLWRPAAAETAPADIRPSDLDGDDEDREGPRPGVLLRRGSGLDRDAASRRGVAIHALLEALPTLPASARADAAPRILHAQGMLEPAQGGAPAAAWVREAVGEALAVLDDPALANLFDPRSAHRSRAEVPFAAVLPALGPGEIHGVIDRLIVTADAVSIVDFKTGAVPRDPPEAYLRQLAVYRAAMTPLYPGRAIRTALLWTATRQLQHIPAAEIDAALRRAAAALDQRGRAS